MGNNNSNMQKIDSIIDRNKIWHNLNKVPKDIKDELVLVIAHRYNKIVFYTIWDFNELVRFYKDNSQLYKFKYAYIKDLLPIKL